MYPCRSSRAAEDERGHAVGATNVSREELRPHSEERDPEQLCLFSGTTKTGARTSEPEP